MKNLPKRKFRLWYSKNDYEKEREEEIKKQQSDQIQNEDAAQAAPPEETAQPPSAENSPPSSETSVDTPQDNVAQPRPAESQVTENITEIQPSAETAVTPENRTEPESSEKVNLPETQPSTAPPPAQSETEVKTEPSAEETQAQPEITNEMMQAQAKELSQQLVVPVENEKKPDQTEAISEPVEVENKVPLIESVENIEKYTDTLKSLLPTRAVVCIGEYPINILLKDISLTKKEARVLPLFVEKTNGDVVKWSQGKLDQNNIACIDQDIDTQFWYDVLSAMSNNENFLARLKNKPTETLQSALMISSSWKGLGSALLPILVSKFKEWNINSVAMTILPSKAQPLDNQINAFASLGMCTSKNVPLMLFDRDKLESYIGVDRNGYAINGNVVANYLVDLMLAKETFVQEIIELSKSFDTKIFSVLLASGLSWKIYGSIENMLNMALVRPLFGFDLSTASILYVLIRMPLNLKEKVPRGDIELAVTNWFNGKADLESIYVADPIYVDDTNDRIDIGLFLSGFETATRFAALEKRVTKIKDQLIKKGAITEEDWQAIAKSLVK